ncbi:MAG: DUF2723 domain-containing protein [Candidatus Firestonebacteria bacterium]
MFMAKGRSIAGLIVFLLSLAVYTATACPSVYVGDSGEMITAAFFLGIPHPPGYPLFCLIGKALSFLPISTIAFRVNLVAVLFGALTVFILFHFLSKLFSDLSQNGQLFPVSSGFNLRKTTQATCSYPLTTESLLFPLVCALLFAFSKTFWAQALMAKGALYTINAFFIITIIHMIYSYRNNMSKRNLILIAFVNGLGLANHNTIAPLSFLFLIYGVSYSKSFKQAISNTLIYAVTAIFTALLLYMYLPLRSAANPAIDWGHPASFYGFLNHVLRKQYSFFAASERSIPLFIEQTKFYFSYLANQLTPVFFLIALPGAWALFKFSKKLFSVLLITFLLAGFGLLLLSNPQMNAIDKYTLEVFFIPSYFAYTAAILFGFFLIISQLRSKTIILTISAAALLSIILPFKVNYFENDKSNNFICHDYGINILRSPVPGSIVFVSGDNGTFATAYFKFVEKARPDIEVYDDYGRVFKNIYGADFLFMPAGVYEKRVTQVQRALINTSLKPVYCLGGSSIYGMNDIPTVNEGLLYRVKSAKAAVFPFQPPLTKRGIDGNKIYLDFWCKEIAAGYYLLEGDRQLEKNNIETAKASYRKAAEIGSVSSNIMSMLGLALGKFSVEEALTLYKETANSTLRSPEIFNNLGVAYFRKGLYDQSLAAYEEAVKLDPNYFKSYFNIGVSYNAKGDIKKALEYFEKTFSKSPAYVDAYYGAANCYFFRKDFENAFKIYLKTTEINPEFAIGYNGAAAAMHSLGRYTEAVKYYKKAISLKPDYLEAYSNLSGAYQALGNKEGAIKTLHTGLRYSPGNPTLTQMLQGLSK